MPLATFELSSELLIHQSPSTTMMSLWKSISKKLKRSRLVKKSSRPSVLILVNTLIFGALLVGIWYLNSGRISLNTLQQAYTPAMIDSSALSTAQFAGITTRNDNVRLSDNWQAVNRRVTIMKELGVTWDRLFVGSGSILNPDGTWNEPQMAHLDRLLDTYTENDLNAYMLLYNSSDLIGFTAECAKENINNTPFSLVNSAPLRKDLWQAYITQLVNRYGSPGSNQIKHWEISFEPNRKECQFYTQPETYAQFLIETSQLIKSIDPSAKVLMGRVYGNDREAYLGRLFDLGVAPHIDIISLGGPYVCHGHTYMEGLLKRLYRVQEQHGVRIPFWMTEVMCASDVNQDGETDTLGLEQQQEFMTAIVPVILNAGVEKIFIQSFLDRPYFEDITRRASGLLTTTLERKSGFYAYQDAIAQVQSLANASIVSSSPTPTPISSPYPTPAPTPMITPPKPMNVPNPSFETGTTTGWNRLADVSAQDFSVVETKTLSSPGSRGRYALRFATKDNGIEPFNPAVYSNLIDAGWALRGHQITISLSVRTQESTQVIKAPAIFLSLQEGSQDERRQFNGPDLVVSPEWNRYSYTLAIPLDLTNATRDFRVVLRAPDSPEPIYYDDVKVTLGSTSLVGDINNDCVVDAKDQEYINASWLKRYRQPGYNILADLNFDGFVSGSDLNLFGQQFGKVCQ